jgi:hypothetical protein
VLFGRLLIYNPLATDSAYGNRNLPGRDRGESTTSGGSGFTHKFNRLCGHREAPLSAGSPVGFLLNTDAIGILHAQLTQDQSA